MRSGFEPLRPPWNLPSGTMEGDAVPRFNRRLRHLEQKLPELPCLRCGDVLVCPACADGQVDLDRLTWQEQERFHELLERCYGGEEAMIRIAEAMKRQHASRALPRCRTCGGPQCCLSCLGSPVDEGLLSAQEQAEFDDLALKAIRQRP
jgi:hypothetical protein